ncbi:MAG: DNA-3-methyladenine glycosylase [Gemmatimonadaceae bacterium]
MALTEPRSAANIPGVPRPNHRRAITHLKRVDPKLAAVIARVGPCRAEVRSAGTHFDALLRSILHQQLSGKAAETIHTRLLALYGDRPPTPTELLATDDATLRSVGLSRQKVAYLRDLAAHVVSDKVNMSRLHELPDDEIVAELINVKGIGRWTAQMFLLFRLGRPDVLPDLDLGIQNGLMRAYGLRKRPTPREVLELGAKWSPYASVASWYLWRSLDEPRAKARRARPARKKVTPRRARA